VGAAARDDHGMPAASAPPPASYGGAAASASIHVQACFEYR
jgi:hypothetical protein